MNLISHDIGEPMFITSNNAAWVVDMSICEISNGRWMSGIDGKYDVYNISILPAKKIKC